MWKGYELVHGLPGTRTEAAIALSGAAVCQSWGSKIKPNDLIPRFVAPKPDPKLGVQLFKAWVKRHNDRQARRRSTV